MGSQKKQVQVIYEIERDWGVGEPVETLCVEASATMWDGKDQVEIEDVVVTVTRPNGNVIGDARALNNHERSCVDDALIGAYCRIIECSTIGCHRDRAHDSERCVTCNRARADLLREVNEVRHV